MCPKNLYGATAYRLQVTGEDGDFSDPLWDTGQSSLSPYIDEGDRTNDLSYTSYLALDGRTYRWRLKLWDATDEGEWSNGEDFFKMYGRIAQNLSYGYDQVGNITWLQDASDTNSAKTMDYDYDDLYRLTRASSTEAANGEDYLQTYNYNAVGNITNKSDIGLYSYNGDQGTNYANPHAATTINGATNSYDRNGNLLSDGTWTHTWTYDNRLASSTNGQVNITYAYDHEGNRVAMTSGNEKTVYPNKYYNINGNKITRHIYAGDELIATIDADGQSTTTYYIHTDHLGGSSVLSDENGQIVEVTDYYPFGNIRLDEKEGGFSEQRKFTGHEYDETTDLEYMIQRYYNGDTGRFNSIDPVYRELGDLRFTNHPEYNDKTYKDQQQKVLSNPHRLNSYSYVLNNPLVYYDPWGLAEVYIRKSGDQGENTDGAAKMGHVMIKVENTYYGFSPTKDEHDDVQIMSEDQFSRYYGEQDWNIVDIGKEYDAGIVEFYTNLESQGMDAKGAEYSKFYNNCTSKAQEALEYSGFDIKTRVYWYTPNGLYNYFNTVQKAEGFYQQHINSNYSPTIKSITPTHVNRRYYNYGA